MNVTKKCELCDTCLEFEDGDRRLVFKAHDDAFCRGATRLRLMTLERALQQMGEDLGLAREKLHRALHRNDVEVRILRDALARAMRFTGGKPRDVEWLLEADNLDRYVDQRLRAQAERQQIAKAMAMSDQIALDPGLLDPKP